MGLPKEDAAILSEVKPGKKISERGSCVGIGVFSENRFRRVDGRMVTGLRHE